MNKEKSYSTIDVEADSQNSTLGTKLTHYCVLSKEMFLKIFVITEI